MLVGLHPCIILVDITVFNTIDVVRSSEDSSAFATKHLEDGSETSKYLKD